MSAEDSEASSAKRIARLETALRELTYAVSHDLRAPLRAVYNALAFAREESIGILPPAADELFQIAQVAAARAQRMVDALLEISRLDVAVPHFRTTALDSVVRGAWGALPPTLTQSLELAVDPEWPKVTADAPALTRLVTLLLENALVFCDGPPKVRVTVEDTGDEVRLTIRDRGIGMAVKDTERAFQLFRRLHANHEYGGGVGAGLAIARRLSDLQGFRIDVCSVVGEGSAFAVSMPKPR